MDQRIIDYTTSGKKNLVLVYSLYLGALLSLLFPFIGAVFVYLNQDKADGWCTSHYLFLLRSAVLGLIGYGLYCITALIVIGGLLYFLLAIWFVLRLVIGLKYCLNHQPHPNPKTVWIR